MAGIVYFGEIGSTGTSTGPHGHLYVKNLKTGEYINPATLRSLQAGLRIGKDRVPALLKDKDNKYQFNPAAGITLTSFHGPRSAPTAGASTFHRGEDWALPEGTPIYYEGPGLFRPAPSQGGYGNLATFITPDKQYELGIGHMKSLGKEAEIKPSGPAATTTATTTSSDPESAALKLLNAIFAPKEKEKEPSLSEQLIGSLVAQNIDSIQPSAFLSRYSSKLTNPYEDVILDPSMLQLG